MIPITSGAVGRHPWQLCRWTALSLLTVLLAVDTCPAQERIDGRVTHWGQFHGIGPNGAARPEGIYWVRPQPGTTNYAGGFYANNGFRGTFQTMPRSPGSTVGFNWSGSFPGGQPAQGQGFLDMQNRTERMALGRVHLTADQFGTRSVPRSAPFGIGVGRGAPPPPPRGIAVQGPGGARSNLQQLLR
jgi:hypothetical protein